MAGYKAKPNELNKRGDRRGKRGKDKGGKRAIYKIKLTDEHIAYWNETLDMIEEQLLDYVKTEKVKTFINTVSVGQPHRYTPEELVVKGVDYFRFVLKHRRNMTIYGLAVHLQIEPVTILRMEQKSYVDDAYKSDVYKPIVRAFKRLVGLFHEEMGSDKINPNFNMFVLKALRGGFEETMDLNLNNEPKGLSENERTKLRGKISKFTENFTKKSK